MARICTPEQRAAKRAYDKARYALIAEKKRANAKAWYAANREKALKRSTEKHAAAAVAAGREPHRAGAPRRFNDAERKARKAAALKAWREANREKFRAQGRRNYRKRRHIILNPDYQRQAHHARRARKVAAGGKFTAADIALVRKRQRGRCAFCLKPLGKRAPHIDHYVPLALGGTNNPSNLRLLHATCNLSKGASDPVEFGLKHGLLAW